MPLRPKLYPGTYEPNIPAAGVNQRHDPRAFAQGFSSQVQGDVVAMHNARRNLAGGIVPLSEVVQNLTALNLPPQIIESSFHATISAFGWSKRQLLIPKNPQRMAWLISNYQSCNLVLFSYDQPFISPAGGDLGAGVVFGNYYQEANGSVSTNDIWVWCNDPAEAYPINVLGYEGGIAPSGNRRQ
jgi:hypothetical protein